MLFKLIMPSDASLVPAIRQVAERVAQCAGYSAAEAQRIASTVGRCVEIVVTRPGSPGSRAAETAPREPLDIRFQRDGSHLDVWLRYRSDGSDASGDAELSREALREGLDSAEFGRDGAVAWCRLRKRLPPEKVDHQCEVPPEGK